MATPKFQILLLTSLFFSLSKYYEGCAPQVYIADAELVRLIFVKDFDHFQNKRIMDFGHELINEMMDHLPCIYKTF